MDIADGLRALGRAPLKEADALNLLQHKQRMLEAADVIDHLHAENERLKSLLTEARENVDLDVRELEAMYAGYPEIMNRKTAADRDLRSRIDAALAAGGE